MTAVELLLLVIVLSIWVIAILGGLAAYHVINAASAVFKAMIGPAPPGQPNIMAKNFDGPAISNPVAGPGAGQKRIATAPERSNTREAGAGSDKFP